MRRWIATVAGMVLAAAPAVAAETTVNWGLKTGAEPRTLCVYDTSTAHTCVPVGQLNSTLHSYGSSLTNCNVTAYGADPTGVTDSSAAFNACAVKTVNGQLANIYAPAGTYLLRNKVTVSAQCLYGDGKSSTFLHIDQAFSSSATSVIYLTGTTDGNGGDHGIGGCVHDLTMKFDQPDDQASRVNFLTLAAGCTGGLGGTGCKYPPAIYNDGVPGRSRLYNLRIEKAWDGINLQRASGVQIDNIDESSLNVGMTLDNGSDFGYIDHWEHWPFGMSGPSNLVTGVWSDGLNFAAKIGDFEGSVIDDLRTYRGRVQLTANYAWGTFIDPKLDSFNATFEVLHVRPATTGLSIIGGYSTAQSLTTTGANNSNCAFDFTTTTSDQRISMTGMSVTSGAGGTTPQLGAVCVAGSGEVTITGGHITSGRLDLPAYYQSGGIDAVTGVIFGPGGGQPRTAYVVSVNGGYINFTGNVFNNAGLPGSVDGLFIAHDTIGHTVMGNTFTQWGFTSPGPLGLYGPNNYGFAAKCTSSGASPQTCNALTGKATTAILSTAAQSFTTYVINNNTVTAASVVGCLIQLYGGTGLPIISACVPGAGTITVSIYNVSTTTALSASMAMGFTVQ